MGASGGSTLGIVGHGIVGRAVSANARCPVMICDRDQPQQTLAYLKRSCAVIVIAVGTPAGPDGSCDTSALAEVLAEMRGYEGPIVSHCTAPATFYAGAKVAHPNLVHVPEFIRAADAVREYAAQMRLVIGGDRDIATVVHRFWCDWILAPHTAMHLVSIETAAMIKYTANVLLASKLMLLGEIRNIGDLVGCDWSVLAEVLSADGRLGHSHWAVPNPDGLYGFGGSCFPKDLRALIAEGEAAGTAPLLLRMVDWLNAVERRKAGSRQ